MRRSVFLTIVGTTALALSGGVAADEDRGYYARLLVGAGSLGDSDVSGSEGTTGDLTFDSGFLGGGAVGYDFGNWRLEGELIYRTNDADSFNGTLALPGALGDFSSLSVGVNALYEFDLFGSPKTTSYIGAGLAFIQEVDIDIEAGGDELSFSGDDVAPQLLAGARYELSPQWALFAEIRHLIGGSQDLEGEGGVPGSLSLDYDHTSINFGVGLRF